MKLCQHNHYIQLYITLLFVFKNFFKEKQPFKRSPIEPLHKNTKSGQNSTKQKFVSALCGVVYSSIKVDIKVINASLSQNVYNV